MTQTSPSKKKKPGEASKPMTFPEAIQQIIMGAKVTKVEWANNEFYALLKDGFLKLHKPDGTFHEWLVAKEDLEGKDFIAL